MISMEHTHSSWFAYYKKSSNMPLAWISPWIGCGSPWHLSSHIILPQYFDQCNMCWDGLKISGLAGTLNLGACNWKSGIDESWIQLNGCLHVFLQRTLVFWNDVEQQIHVICSWCIFLGDILKTRTSLGAEPWWKEMIVIQKCNFQVELLTLCYVRFHSKDLAICDWVFFVSTGHLVKQNWELGW
jgi:hypothetical protein